MTDPELPGLKPDASVRLPTDRGEFQLNLYIDPKDGKEHLALVHGHASASENGVPLVRIHSECITGDVLGSSRCDCGHQLHHALDQIAKSPFGILIYLRQEGRGIGLLQKLRAYDLQDKGYDTVQANELLGHKPDERDYSMAAEILKHLGVKQVELITNNPDKIAGLEDAGIEILKRVASPLAVSENNRSYLKTKADKLRHIFDKDSF